MTKKLWFSVKNIKLKLESTIREYFETSGYEFCILMKLNIVFGSDEIIKNGENLEGILKKLFTANCETL